MSKLNILTICGSLKFQKEMIQISEELELQGICVLSPVYPTREDKAAYTKEELLIFDKMHKEKIKLSDAIFVVNVDGYIGSSTRSEIEYAKSPGKEILYYTDFRK